MFFLLFIVFGLLLGCFSWNLGSGRGFRLVFSVLGGGRSSVEACGLLLRSILRRSYLVSFRMMFMFLLLMLLSLLILLIVYSGWGA